MCVGCLPRPGENQSSGMPRGEIRPLAGGKRKPQWAERKPGHRPVTTLTGKKGGVSGMPVLVEADGQNLEEGLALKPGPFKCGCCQDRAFAARAHAG